MYKYKTAIFDMDGTLLNTLPDLRKAVNHALSEFGYAPRSYDDIRSFIGNGVRMLVKRSLPSSVSKEDYEKVLSSFTDFYNLHNSDECIPYDGIIDALTTLKSTGVRLGVVSNKTDSLVKELCDSFFPGLFDVQIGDREGYANKPSADLIFLCMKDLSCEKESTIYIGDTEVDIQTAYNSGLKCMSVSWGYRDREFLIKNGASITIDTPSELLSFFIPS